MHVREGFRRRIHIEELHFRSNETDITGIIVNIIAITRFIFFP